MHVNKDLMAASSTPIVLAILADGDSYGYAILQRVRELSGGRIEWTDGMLYPVLHRLERLDHIKARWEVAESGRRRKYSSWSSRRRIPENAKRLTEPTRWSRLRSQPRQRWQ
ncbi:MAG: PadR family transcriptional regulator [Xanthomonadaceae bacterium]|nr:PadR family transcriptional regulator [Xanthomonadaceae bacterium]